MSLQTPRPTSLDLLEPKSEVGEPALPAIATPRLRLRWLDVQDIDDLFRVFSDAQATRYWSHATFASRDDASIYLDAIHRSFDRGESFQWGVTLAGSGQLIGTCTLSRIDAVHGRAEVGFIISRSHWGHRYGREVLGALLDHAFSSLGLRRLEADIDPRNQTALQTLESVGFKREGYLRQRWQLNGETQDSILLGLLDNERLRHG